MSVKNNRSAYNNAGISVSGIASTDLLPDVTGTRNIGSSTDAFLNLYSTNLFNTGTTSFAAGSIADSANTSLANATTNATANTLGKRDANGNMKVSQYLDSIPFGNSLDLTRQIKFDCSGMSTGTTLTITPLNTTAQDLTIPNVVAGDQIVTKNATQTLTGKTLTSPVISTISNTGTLTLPTSTDTLVGRATTDTLTNKTLTSPVISTISNTGTLTLPTSTDTLVGRATTDTLTNKTLTSPVISTISNTGTITLPTATDTLVARGTTDTLTNKTIDGVSSAFNSNTIFKMTVPTPITATTTLTMAQIAATFVELGGTTAAQTLTFPAAATMWSYFTNPFNGLSFEITIYNNSTQTWTLAAGTNTTSGLVSNTIASGTVRYLTMTLVSNVSAYIWF